MSASHEEVKPDCMATPSKLFNALKVVRKELAIYASVQGWNQDISAAIAVADEAIKQAEVEQNGPHTKILATLKHVREAIA